MVFLGKEANGTQTKAREKEGRTRIEGTERKNQKSKGGTGESEEGRGGEEGSRRRYVTSSEG